jgi:hypothetical protein
MAGAKKSCLILTRLLDTLSNDNWTHCQMIIGHIVHCLLDTLGPYASLDSKIGKIDKRCRKTIWPILAPKQAIGPKR